MSLQGLVSGSECAVPFNPLSQVLKHTEGDRSLQQDRIAGPSSSRLQQLPSTSTDQSSERDIALARQFFDGNAPAPNAGPVFVMPQHMSPADMSGRMMEPRHAADLNMAWVESQHQQFLQNQNPLSSEIPQSGWAGEFGYMPQGSLAGPSVQQNASQRPDFYQSPYMSSGMYGGGMQTGMYSGMALNATPAQFLDKGKGKSRDIDFEAAFAQVAQSLSSSQTESARIVEVTEDNTANLEDALKNASLQDGNEETLGSSFKEVWDHLQDSSLPPPAEDMAKWEAQYNQMMNSQREELDLDYGADMQAAWENDVGAYDQMDKGLKFDDEGLPILGDYIFEPNNKYLDPSSSTRSLLDDAKALLERNGSLTEAALLLEAAIQKGELGKGEYEAWILLGEVRSMDEREEAGMRALQEGVKRAQAAGAAGEGMLSLAISFTNESYERAAHTMLLRWLTARFPEFSIPPKTWESLSQSAWHSNERVTDAFLSLAREQHSKGIMDPDVQIGLGVLSYSSGDYDRAKDCFETALSARPNDYLLWNRLGSSLSNGNNPEAALGAYREALQLQPTYTRAIYNVGVACLNIGAHKEAAEHFLSALAMQDSSSGSKSDQLWSTLQRVLMSMDRRDLAEQAVNRANLEVFRKEGFDF